MTSRPPAAERLGERGGFELYRSGDSVLKLSTDEGVLRAAPFHHLYAERVLDSGKDGDGTWLLVEPARGQPLDEILRAQGPLPVRRFLPLYERVCEAIAAAHDAGLGHGALDAAHIQVVARRGQLVPKVIDFRGGDPRGDLDALVRLAREALGDAEALTAAPDSARELPEALRAAAGLVEELPPPTLPDEIRLDAMLRAPQPVAEAVAALDGADDPLDAVWQVVRTTARWIGLLALASRDRTTPAGEAVQTALRKLRLFGLSSHEWVDLARELLRPYASRQDAHPVPELVGLFFDETGAEIGTPWDGILAEHPDSGVGALPDAAATLGTALPQVASLLDRLTFLADYPLAVPHGDRAELWMGVRRHQRPSVPLALAAPVLTGRDGAPILPLAPFVQAAPLVPGAPAELFLLEGKGRRGARMVALPTELEREDEAPWAALGLPEEPEAKPGPALERSPFPGLHPYTADDAGLFFGREQEIARCGNRLRKRPVLAVVGPAGAGKRSFVQAGLVPTLPEEWRAIVFRPGKRPVAAMAEQLQAQGIDADVADPEAFGEALRAAARPGVLALVVTRLEDIFAPDVGDDERRRFATLLGSAARDAADPVRVVVTVRDDCFLAADGLPGLRDRMTFEILRRPARADLARILVDSARRAGYAFEDDRLVDEMAAEAETAAAPLAALSFAGLRMWQERRERTLTRQALASAGGVAGAIERWAEDAFAALSPEEQAQARDVFRQLPAPCDALPPVADKLVQARLASMTGDTVELVHETLVDTWPRLRAWRQEEAHDPPFAAELRAAAARWEQGERAPDLLLRGDALAELRQWRRRSPRPLGDREEALVQTSLDSAAASTRSRRLVGIGTVGLAALAALALVGRAPGGASETPAADAARRRADALEKTVTAAYFSEGRRLALAGEPAMGLVYLAAAYERGARGAAVELALARALQAVRAELTEVRHDDVVTGAAFSPDGRRLLTSSWDRTARMWDARTGALLLSLAHDAQVYAAAFSPDGETIATASIDGKARLFDAGSGALRHTLAGHADRIRAIAFSPDGKRLVTASADSTAKIWDVAAGTAVHTLGGHKHGVTTAVFSADGARVATAGGDGTARLWDAATGRQVVALAGHDDLVNDVALSRDGSLAVTASDDGTARLWEVRGGRLRARLDHRAEVVWAAFGGNGERVVTASADRTAKVWDAATGRLLFVISGHEATVTRAAFSPDGKRIATASDDRTVQVWDTETGRRVARLTGHAGRVSTLAWDPAGERVASGGHDGLAIVWNGAPEAASVGLRGHSGAVTWAAFSPDGSRALTAGTDGAIKVWDVAAAREVATLAGHQDVVLRAGFSPDGRRIVSASLDKTARVWNAQTGTTDRVLTHAGPVLDAAFSPDGRQVATASADKTAAVWDAATGAQLRALTGFPDNVYGVTYTPDGGRLIALSDGPARVFDAASGAALEPFPARLTLAKLDGAGRRLAGTGLDQAVRVWDFASRGLMLELEGHVGGVEDVDFSPDGHLLVSAGGDGTAKVWDAETGDLIASFAQHEKRVTSASFSPDRRRLLTSSSDGTALLWALPSFDLDPARLRALVRCRVPYQLEGGRLIRVPIDRGACAAVK